jgi:hypothetical protein
MGDTKTLFMEKVPILSMAPGFYPYAVRYAGSDVEMAGWHNIETRRQREGSERPEDGRDARSYR